jgi:hypothetical protein
MSVTAKAPIFREVQKVHQWWIWALVLGVAAFAWVIFFTQVVLDIPFGNKPAPDPVLWIILVVMGILAPFFVQSCRLTTEVGEKQLTMSWFPLYRRNFAYRDIASVEAVTYHPLLHYGGWGLRYNPWRGWVYSMSGNRGVQLVLKDGKRVLIGSYHAEELAHAIVARRYEQLGNSSANL